MSKVAHQNAGERSPLQVGDLGRRIFMENARIQRVRYPQVKGMSLPGGRAVLSLSRFLFWFTILARAISRRGDRSLRHQIADILAIGAKHHLDAQAYYMFELYRPENRQRAGGYLTRYETKNGLFKLLARQQADHQHRTRLDDKLKFHEFCRQHAIPHPPLLAVAKEGSLQGVGTTEVVLDQDLFVKPVESKGSRGVEGFRKLAPGRFRDESGRELDLPALVRHLSERSQLEPILVQSRLSNHPGIADLAGESLIAIRVFSCLDRTAGAIVTHGMLRVITRLEHSWPVSWELGVAIDLATGRMGPMTADKWESLLYWWDEHPITKAPITGRVLPHWDEIKRLVVAAHNACVGRWMVGWDVAVTPQGPMLLEGNAYPDVDFPQRVHRCSIGDSPLGPPLYACLVDLERRMIGGAPGAGPSAKAALSKKS